MPPNRHEPPKPELSARDIINGFTALSGIGIENNESAHSWLTTESLYAVAALERKLIGQSIHARELPSAREIGQRAITRWGKKNEHQAIGAPDPNVEYSDLRTHPKNGNRYVRNDSFRFARRSSGIIEAVDARLQSLVVKPTIGQLWWDRHWVQILGPDGEQLVDLEL